MTSKYLGIAIFVIVFYGCDIGKRKDQIGNILIYRLEKENPKLLSNAIDSVSFLPLKEEEFFFSRANKLSISEKYIYIMDTWDSNSLLVFDGAGSFVRKIGNRGQGPGEYIRLWDFYVDTLYIYLYDYNTTKLFKYDLQGNYIEGYRMPFTGEGFKILKNKKYLFALERAIDKNQVIRIDSVFQTEASFFSFGNKGNFQLSQHMDNVFHKVGEVISYYEINNNDTIYTFNEEGEPTGGVFFDFGSKKIPANLRNDLEKLTDSNNYIYHVDTPFKIGKLWIGQVRRNDNRETFVYDTGSNEYYFYDDESEQFDYVENIINPLFINSRYIVGIIDMEIYNNMKIKPPLDDSAITIMEEGGHVLCFYYLKQK
jgi:hypothetical protein